ncbi:MAG: aspartate kinase [Dehalococcoidia bacterium]|nr:aspartate kinase [Chloroflexota bacterium]|tara:strand:+ start:416 stop:1633 length:1218 start_codon:yes stop_codon:yes gene_type:complete
MSNLIVQKYGGSSLSNLDEIKFVAKKIKGSLKNSNKIVIVVSAMGDTTDELVKLGESFLKNNNEIDNLRDFDQLLSTGEIISASLMSMSLREIRVNAISLTGQKAGIFTDDLHGSARISSIDKKVILNELKERDVVIVAGFQGVSEYGEVTTLGRGGSDTTAVAIASALNAKRCEIYTDVKGIFTADPRLVNDGKLISNISYDEMLEMASLGAKMHPRSIEIASINKVEMIIKHTKYESEGTRMSNDEVKMEKRNAVTGIPTSTGVSKVTINNIDDKPGIASSIFLPLSKMGISVDVIVQAAGNDGKTNLSFTLEDKNLDACVKELIKNNIAKKENINTQSGLGKVSIVGTGIQNQPGYASRMFETLSEKNINIEMITTSEIRITCIINSDDLSLAAQSLHNEFI